MLNKLAESYNQFRSKADEVRQTVTQQAAKAREALGIPSFLQHSDASRLERELEHQISQISGLKELREALIKILSQICTSSDIDAPLYFDYPQQTFTFDFPSFILGTSPTKPSSSSESLKSQRDAPAGDLSSKSSWIASYHPKQSPSKNSETSQSANVPPPPTIQQSGPLNQMDQHDDKKHADSDHVQCSSNGMTFRQVFLRSQALEVLLLTIARLDIRSKLVGPSDGDGIEQLTNGVLHHLMTLTMEGNQKLHTQLLFLFCSVDLNSEVWEVHLRHLAELTALLKLDWQQDHYGDSIRRITTEVDALRHALRQITIPHIPVTEQKFLLDQSEEKEPRSQVKPGSEDYDVLIDAATTQIEKKCAHSRRIAELELKIDKLIEKSNDRSKVIEEMVTKRISALRSSADTLSQQFLNLQTKAADKGESVAHESKEANAQVEKNLEEAILNKTRVDSDVEALQRERRELLAQLQMVEKKLVDLLAEQRKAHDLVDTLEHSLETLKKNFDHKAAVVTELMRQSELHQLDMKNMKILIEESKGIIQTDVKQFANELMDERNRLKQQLRPDIMNYLEYEVERLKLNSLKFSKGLMVLEDVWKSKREKEMQLETQREQYRMCQSQYQQLLERYRVEEANELKGAATSSSSSSLSSQLEQTRRELEQFRAAVEAASGGLEILKGTFYQVQQRCLNSSEHLNNIWKALTQFVEVHFALKIFD